MKPKKDRFCLQFREEKSILAYEIPCPLYSKAFTNGALAIIIIPKEA
jgi:hypothetical protein